MSISVAYLTAAERRGSPKVRFRKSSGRWSGYFWYQGKSYERALIAKNQADALTEIGSIRSVIIHGVASASDHETIKRLAPLVPPATSGVYALRDARGFVKIGRATNIQGRIHQLQCGNVETIELVAILSRRQESERWFQKRLENSGWVRGEWFAPSPRVLEVIAQGRAQF